MIYCFCKCYGLKLPRRYRKRARKEYLAFAKSRKHKVKAPVEFGAKFDLSLDSEGYGRIEKISFEAYNESTFSLSKRCYGMSCITTKLEETQLTSIALSVFVTNLFRIQRRILYALLHLFRFWHDWNRCKSWKLQIDT